MLRLIAAVSRAFATFVAVVPLLVSTDPCTVGALTGRASVVCVARAEAALACAAQSPQPACSHCGQAAPEPGGPRPSGDTCCDLKPQAPGAAQQPALAFSPAAAHPACIARAEAPEPTSAWLGVCATAPGESPPGAPPSPGSPRAPPLA